MLRVLVVLAAGAAPCVDAAAVTKKCYDTSRTSEGAGPVFDNFGHCGPICSKGLGGPKYDSFFNQMGSCPYTCYAHSIVTTVGDTWQSRMSGMAGKSQGAYVQQTMLEYCNVGMKGHDQQFYCTALCRRLYHELNEALGMTKHPGTPPYNEPTSKYRNQCNSACNANWHGMKEAYDEFCECTKSKGVPDIPESINAKEGYAYNNLLQEGPGQDAEAEVSEQPREEYQELPSKELDDIVKRMEEAAKHTEKADNLLQEGPGQDAEAEAAEQPREEYQELPSKELDDIVKRMEEAAKHTEKAAQPVPIQPHSPADADSADSVDVGSFIQVPRQQPEL